MCIEKKGNVQVKPRKAEHVIHGNHAQKRIYIFIKLESGVYAFKIRCVIFSQNRKK